MSEWDKSWNIGAIMYYLDKTPENSTLEISLLVSDLRKIKSEGYKIQKHNVFLLTEIDNYSEALNGAYVKLEAVREILEVLGNV